MPSSSAPGCRACTSSTGCANSACGCACSRPAPRSAAPGTGTAIPARASIPRAIPTATPSRRSCCDEWEWSEHFAGQPETLRYCKYVADKFDLRRDIQFSSRVTAAVYDEPTRSWGVALEDGSRFSARFLITAIGPLSTPTLPRIEGRDSFEGRSFHTARWPKEPVDFKGQRVAVIGTGATGVQTIQTIAGEVGHLTVFQRTPNWCAPLHNGKIDAETQAAIKAGYPEMFARCQETFACFLHTPDPRGAFEVTDEEREAFYEKLYGERGFGIWQGNFKDILIDRKANATISDFVARKIRQRVKNQAVAEKLIPKNHGFGTRRLPLETFYYEVYNRDNVELVDITRRRSSGSRPRASRPARRNMHSTSSSSPPASTPSPAPSTGSISGGLAACC